MADDVVGKLIFKVETDTKDAKKGLDSFQDEMKETQTGAKKTEQTVDKADKAIKASAIGIAVAVGTALIKLGKQVAEATKDIQDGQKAIVNATGATGGALESLMSSAKKVFASNSASFEDVSNAIGEINTRLGLTGGVLEETTDSFIKFSQTTGQDVKASVQSVTQVMNRWGVEAEKLPQLLDKLTVAGQQSGVSVATLEANLTSGAGTLQAMGYSLDEATSMMMSFELAGIDSSQVLMGMKKSFEDSAKAGTDARTDWENLIASISESTSEAEANSIAIETFGNRIATDMVTALRSGSVSFDEFKDAIEKSDGALEKTHATAKTASDRFEEFKNKLSLLMSSVGEGIINLFFGQKTAVDDLATSVNTLTTHMDEYKSATEKLKKPIDEMTESERRLYEIQQRRAKIAVEQSLVEVADSYKKVQKEVEKYTNEIADEEAKLKYYGMVLDDVKNGTSNAVTEYNRLFDMRDKGIELTEEEQTAYKHLGVAIKEMNNAFRYGAGEITLQYTLGEMYEDAYNNMTKATYNLEKASIDTDEAIVNLAIAFNNGYFDLDAYSKLYPELTARIRECADSMKVMEEAEEEGQSGGSGGSPTEKKIELTQAYIDRLKEQEDAIDEAYADELEKQGKIADAYDMRIIKVQHNASEELKAIRDKINKGEALEEDYENARLYWENVESQLRKEKYTKIKEANAKEVEEEEKKAKELEEIRKNESDAWTERLRKQAEDARAEMASEKESMGLIEEAYEIRESIIRDEWKREKDILEEKVKENKATQAEIEQLDEYYNNEVEKNNKKKTDAIAKQEAELAKTIKENMKDAFKSSVNMALSAVNQLADVFSGFADNYKTQLDKMEKARNEDIEGYKQNADERLEYLNEMLEKGIISEEQYKKNKEQIEKDLEKATKQRTEKDAKAEKELRQKVNDMERKAFEAKKKTAIAQAIIDGASAVMKGFAELGPIAGAVYAGVQAGITTAQTIVIANQEYVPSYAVGSKYIPRNQLAMLHEGEMVLTRRESTKMREIGGVDNLERMVSGSVGTESRSLEPMRIDNQLNAVIEVDGTQLGIAVLKNIDNASQFVLR